MPNSLKTSNPRFDARGLERHAPAPVFLSRPVYARALAELAACDRDLGRVLERHGPPPLWARKPGFPCLVHMILEQQVSLASARAAFEKLRREVSPLTPAGFLSLSDGALKRAGFSRQKSTYTRALARALQTRDLVLRDVARQPDEQAREALVRVKGIGRWTADVYLLMALRRPDVWPAGDLALEKALVEVKGPRDPERTARRWRPWRSVAARVLWHHYLRTRDRS